MMSNNLKDNPFAALFDSVKAAERFRDDSQFKCASDSNKYRNDQNVFERKPTLFEQLLLVSPDRHLMDFTYLCLEDSPDITPDTLDLVLFERLLLENPENFLIKNPGQDKSKNELEKSAVQNKVISYLYDVFKRSSQRQRENSEITRQVQISCVNQILTILEQPEICPYQDPRKQFLNLLSQNLPQSKIVCSLVSFLLQSTKERGEFAVLQTFEQLLTISQERLQKSSLMSIDWDALELIEFFTEFSLLIPLLLQVPKAGTHGKDFENSILGSLLSVSCIPKGMNHAECHFFENASNQPMQSHKATENSIGLAQNNFLNRIHSIFMKILKASNETKHQLLKWVERCLESNSGRSGMWHIQTQTNPDTDFVSDGFMINLALILLKISAPFTRDIFQENKQNFGILKVDPLYCSKEAHLKSEEIEAFYPADLYKQTMLVPSPQECVKANSVALPKHFSFITSCFYLTHRAFHLGIQVSYQKIIKLSQELGRLSQEFQEISGQDNSGTEMVRKHMEGRTSLFLTYKAAVFHSSVADAALEFLAASSFWLTQMAFKCDSEIAPFEFKKIEMEDLSLLSDRLDSNAHFSHIPEFVVENVVEGVIAINRFASESFYLSGEKILRSFMTLISCFMGSPHLMNNPHLRAHLAECLETLVPKDDSSPGLVVRGVQDQLFKEHSLAMYFPTALIHVFVSIEMTGQSVAFEEKFNYRRPMYEVLKYLWSVPDHRKQFVSLAEFALDNMESATPPLFLRFVNLLINDAIFLLDEGLGYMSQIRESQIERDDGGLENLRPDQRMERERNWRQNRMLARFHNMLGSRTTQTLVMLTEEIPTMFTHPTLIDRMAAMLNHFLNHLVGPKQRNLKVRDMEKYEFRPSDIVSDICSIYCNLNQMKNFSTAVSADERSYTPELFVQAFKVLTKIGRHQLRMDLEAFAEDAKKANEWKSCVEDLVARAPEEFIDPIMLHLMMDPVCLPSSKMTVDRQTIARHLLSDQSDPFNRQPLTMDQIVPDVELKAKIEQWIKEQKEGSS